MGDDEFMEKAASAAAAQPKMNSACAHLRRKFLQSRAGRAAAAATAPAAGPGGATGTTTAPAGAAAAAIGTALAPPAGGSE